MSQLKRFSVSASIELTERQRQGGHEGRQQSSVVDYIQHFGVTAESKGAAVQLATRAAVESAVAHKRFNIESSSARRIGYDHARVLAARTGPLDDAAFQAQQSGIWYRSGPMLLRRRGVTTRRKKPVDTELTLLLDSLKPGEVRADLATISSMLKHRSYLVRLAAASALARARTGERELIAALGTEKNDLVISELADAVAALHAQDSLPRLRQLAHTHPSRLAKSYAVQAIWHLQGRKAGSFLKSLLRTERSPYVRAVIETILFVLGDGQLLPSVLRRLASKDYRVRCLISTLLAEVRVIPERAAIREALRRGMEKETSVAAWDCFKRALAALA